MEFDVFYPPSISDMWFLGENLLVDFLEMGMDLCNIIFDTVHDFMYETLDFSGYYLSSII